MKKIKRKCECGCGNVTNYGRKLINGHCAFGNANMLGKKHSKGTKKKMSLSHKGKIFSKEARLNMFLARMGNTSHLGHKHSKESKLRMSLANIKCNSNSPYCDIWHDREYKKDIRKDYCENVNCKKISKRFQNHHIYLDKKRCAPNDIMTLCGSCHPILHAKLQEGKIPANPKNYVIINRPGHVSYILKKSRKIIKILKRRKECV